MIPTSTWAAPTAGSTCPRRPAIPPFHPDNLAPAPFTTYIFGFRNVTGLTDVQTVRPEEQGAALRAAVLGEPVRPGQPGRLHGQLTNLGLALRPDLFDAHTLHWHGFRNVIPFFDGEPTGSVSVPTGRDFTYVYRPATPARTCTTATSRTSSTCTWA